MKAANISANQNPEPEDPRYCCLAEFSLSEFVSGHDRRDKHTAELLFQALRELAISPEWAENIETTLSGFAKAALEHHQDGRLASPAGIRIICQKKVIDDAASSKTLRLYPKERAIEHARLHAPGDK